jgi:hypothetical protein
MQYEADCNPLHHARPLVNSGRPMISVHLKRIEKPSKLVSLEGRKTFIQAWKQTRQTHVFLFGGCRLLINYKML